MDFSESEAPDSPEEPSRQYPKVIAFNPCQPSPAWEFLVESPLKTIMSRAKV